MEQKQKTPAHMDLLKCGQFKIKMAFAKLKCLSCSRTLKLIYNLLSENKLSTAMSKQLLVRIQHQFVSSLNNSNQDHIKSKPCISKNRSYGQR